MVDFCGQVLVTNLLVESAEWPPALHDYCHLLVLIGQYELDGLEALPIKADVQDEVTVCRPSAERTVVTASMLP